MKLDFDACMKLGKLVKTKPDEEFAKSELAESRADLERAKSDLSQKDWKWATTKAYYSMFHAAKALLHKTGYKERHSHACVIEGIKEVFAKTGILPEKFIDYIETGKVRREEAVYESNYSESSARRYVEAAEEFYLQARTIIE